MFDPLDLYEVAEANVEETLTFVESNSVGAPEYYENKIDDDSPIDILDLPSIRYAPENVVLCVLRLLRPNTQVNFHADTEGVVSIDSIRKQKEISENVMDEVINWYGPNARLNTVEKIFTKIPSNSLSKDTLLSYYTSVLKHFTDNKDIVKEVTLRISENCGRNAMPSTYREFQINNLKKIVKLFEPSLTNDNLGWKTWGSSLILSNILCDRIDENFLKSFNGKRILELGSGTGLVGISVASKLEEIGVLDEYEIYLTDLPEIVTNLEKNISINQLANRVVSDVLDWTNPESFVSNYGDTRFDVLLISDPIYSSKHPQWVVNMIDNFLSQDNHQARCYLQIPIRDKFANERENLKKLLVDKNFEVVKEMYSKGFDDWGEVKYYYRELKRKSD
ncbi:hypothetical protein KAFR_0C04250 [Kazachstania africana CBS 2517]|uniref:Uncharacterized protein n=1 Tax=Kazachstania africana (strain ATCC 22294 / BCRC 22015 / CBS 2517 / CECT 1963 / NBRC 1671 / NRRL Y-8276) TaxID=1071382 RepID=H2ASR6_KAZAF|nr:hypothetical protein KAFR_0C04250 [Kazachstania africana CBS 2517]CCF57416.1 hypothetical protein KAFR_0C04250 [Kazachstania africana CBS 2517]